MVLEKMKYEKLTRWAFGSDELKPEPKFPKYYNHYICMYISAWIHNESNLVFNVIIYSPIWNNEPLWWFLPYDKKENNKWIIYVLFIKSLFLYSTTAQCRTFVWAKPDNTLNSLTWDLRSSKAYLLPGFLPCLHWSRPTVTLFQESISLRLW